MVEVLVRTKRNNGSLVSEKYLMNLIRLANQCGVTTKCLQDLIDGFVNEEISKSFGVSKISLQIFLDGGTSSDLALKIGMTDAELRELRGQIEHEGAVGMIIGLLLKLNAFRSR